MQITPNRQVTLHFALALEDGSLIDSTFEKSPASLVVGDGNLLPGFEKHLLGLQSGDKQTFTISPADGFGALNPNNVQTMKRSDFAADIELQEGLIVSFADAQKAELPGVVAKLEGETVVVDFNHPLAGKNLLFTVEIIAVNEAEDSRC